MKKFLVALVISLSFIGNVEGGGALRRDSS